MKKKHCLDEPEIEKEVKRLFRTDNEAVDVKWQLLTEEELSAGKGAGGIDGRSDTNLGEQDLFGALSDIEEDDGPDHDRSSSKIEAPSEGDSTMYGADLDTSRTSSHSHLVTEFSKDMFKPSPASNQPSTSGNMGAGENTVAVKLAKINTEISELRKRKQEMERNIATCNNDGLRQRFREDLFTVESKLRAAEEEHDSLSMFHF